MRVMINIVLPVILYDTIHPSIHLLYLLILADGSWSMHPACKLWTGCQCITELTHTHNIHT